MRSKLILICTLCCISYGVLGQFSSEKDTLTSHVLLLQNTVVGSASSELPFWLLANNSGRLTEDQGRGYLFTAKLYKHPLSEKFIDYFYALETQGFLGARASASVIQAYGGVQIGQLQAHAGLKEEVFGINDSTLSIGNLVYGRNARPIPKVVLSTPNWVKAPFLGSIFSFKVYLAHGWFEQDRYQSNALLHQKLFYTRARALNNKLTIIAGLHHSAQWGGTNTDREDVQPVGITNYLRIFSGSSGGSSASSSDQQNALGNHLGSYDLSMSYSFRKFSFSGYTQFIWEDKSGLTPFNWRDGLYGFSIKSHDGSKLITGFNAELIRTSSQDAVKHDGEKQIIEPDNFFNNYIYQSGWTHHGRMIGNPVFIILNPDGVSPQKVKNMVNGVNMGIEGQVKKIQYRLNYVSLKNHGNIVERLTPGLRLNLVTAQLSIENGLNSFGMRGVVEWGNYPGRNAGLTLSYARKVRF